MQTQLLDTVIRAANAEAGYKNLHRYILFLHFAFDAIYKLKRDGAIVSQKFLILNMINRRVKLPDNVIGIVKVGKQVGNMILPGVPDNSLSIDPSAPVAPDAELLNNFVFPSAFFQFTVSLATPLALSMSGIRYKLDRATKEIVFASGGDGDRVYLEVIESGYTPGTGTIIPQEAVLPVKSYIHYRFSRFKTGAASAETGAASREYEDELDEAQAAMSDLTGSAIYHAMALRNLAI